MATEGYNSADLTSVLRTLSALSNNQSHHRTSASVHQSSYPGTPPAVEDEDDDPYEPAEASSSLPVAQVPPARPQQTPTGSGAPTAQAGAHPSSTAGDSSTITTWPAALRHVMRAVSQNEESQRRIRRLIQSQHDHERQWWQGREALLTKQKARIEKKKELDAVLRSVGAPVDTKQVSTVEEDQAELGNYDAKVYKASRQMAEAMTSELRALRIPFFTLRENLISEVSKHPRDDASASHSPHGSGSTKGDPLTREEVSVLQRRMLELLQDLCRE
ncbi:uncharacterized protein ACLA_005740 [Aspergillus clavatus NRRL 1]|uniref:Uncharacterized protein n=1 Tax=Aspergillus clavatus (strain ATCC 1007 / CBS 513.65 / DSM 816 / NCTC 3887 / NRRL 1 / QM 1276 / 107) TaxID=344612 RepID=A1CD91_ASPCL|nr:uncharacterized protein ACLA_005740 [Aspergillus clavatus NRRL 1]EAW11818.1 conserved hypothetical protein [Aspergillus clavatus NRRL 1]